MTALKTFKPLYDLRKEEFDEMRDWAKGKCVLANTIDEEKTITNEKTYQNLDL
jgi:hypothetical protein